MKELLKEKLAKQFTTVQFEFIEQFDELTLKFDKSAIVNVCAFLKDEDGLKFNFCE
ncbi:MAG: NADH-quinone oxidoreductase subunit C, partial [Ignavibacteria bacterium]|nr:NADH-quinone oxidoreductase subunit C [Ignavibacteria bacterium]